MLAYGSHSLSRVGMESEASAGCPIHPRSLRKGGNHEPEPAAVYQGTTSVVPKDPHKTTGFSPGGAERNPLPGAPGSRFWNLGNLELSPFAVCRRFHPVGAQLELKGRSGEAPGPRRQVFVAGLVSQHRAARPNNASTTPAFPAANPDTSRCAATPLFIFLRPQNRADNFNSPGINTNSSVSRIQISQCGKKRSFAPVFSAQNVPFSPFFPRKSREKRTKTCVFCSATPVLRPLDGRVRHPFRALCKKGGIPRT